MIGRNRRNATPVGMDTTADLNFSAIRGVGTARNFEPRVLNSCFADEGEDEDELVTGQHGRCRVRDVSRGAVQRRVA